MLKWTLVFLGLIVAAALLGVGLFAMGPLTVAQLVFVALIMGAGLVLIASAVRGA